MDTSETYIKMCEKAKEIQKLWSGIEDVSLLPSYVFDTTTKSVAIMIWTPNKLAGIIRKEHPSQGNALIASIEWWDEKDIGYEDVGDSWRTDTIWLPRQDQLQAMYLKDMPAGTYQKVATLAEAFHDYHETHGYPVYAYSMEQLWFAFMMKEKHNKVWGGESWES